jgi:hypothetical protein
MSPSYYAASSNTNYIIGGDFQALMTFVKTLEATPPQMFETN